MALLLALAFALRLHGLSFGLPALNDSDELMFEMGALRMLRGPTLNPGWFGHPATITMYLLSLINASVFAIGHLAGYYPTVSSLGEALYADPTPAILPGRIAMALFGVGTVALTWQLGRRLFGEATGLVAASFLALNPVHILYSQVIRSDMMATFFMLLCLLAALRIARADRWRDHVLAALWLALAVASKWPFAMAALGVAGAVLLRHAQDSDNQRRHAMRFALFLLTGVGFLCLLSPYLVIDFAQLVRNLQGEAQEHHLGATGGSPLWNAWWYLRGPLAGGLGPAGLALALWGLWLCARRREALAMVLPVAAGFFLLFAVQNLVWTRWSLPLMPILSIAAAAALVDLIGRLAARWGRNGARAVAAILAIVIAVPLLLQAQANARGKLDDARQRASAWARAHIPPGSTVLVEHFALDLVRQPWTFLFPLGDIGCVDAHAYLHRKVGYATVEQARGSRSNVDYGTVSPDRVDSCRADYAILTQYDRYVAERATFPEQYRAYARLLGQGEIVATFQPQPGSIIFEPAVRIVRFRNDRHPTTFSPQDSKSQGESDGRDRKGGQGAGGPIL